MKDLEEIKREHPHLIEQLNLWQRLQRLMQLDVSVPDGPDTRWIYTRDDLVEVLDILSEALPIEKEALDEIEELLITADIDLRRLPFGELPAEGKGWDAQMEAVLFLLSKPMFLKEGRRLSLNGIFWQEGRCPVCGAHPSVSLIGREEKRRFWCSYCETNGYWKRIGCPHCLTETPEDLFIIGIDGQEGIRADICKRCSKYFKSFDISLLKEYTPALLDLISIPLDIVVQKRGYRRASPNPIGLKRLL